MSIGQIIFKLFYQTEILSIRELKVMLHGRFPTTTFSATPRSNDGTVLQPFQTVSQLCCDAVLW